MTAAWEETNNRINVNNSRFYKSSRPLPTSSDLIIAEHSGSHYLFPEVSAHLLAVSMTVHWLEYVDWGDAILQEPLKIVDGLAIVADRPGAGLEWDADLTPKP